MRGKNGLYGGVDSDVQSGRTLAAIIDENDRYEREEFVALRRAVCARDWAAVTIFCDDLKRKGWSQSRIDSLISRATCGAI